MTGVIQEDRERDHRARELYHYFQPDNPALLPTGHCALESINSLPVVKASPNLVLTALAQLAAVKLQAQRAIISLIDRETLYVVAEASRSLNLANNGVYDDDGDSLWMGCSRGPVAGTLCEKTITRKPSNGERHSFFIVEDLKEHPIYCNLPCVAGPPHFRYYAGTPLRTPNGINIGSLYLIDPRPNLCLSESNKETLGTIADAVMEYLETSRSSLEAQRLDKMLSGLNTFVQGVSTEAPSETQYHSSSVPVHHLHTPTHQKTSEWDEEADFPRTARNSPGVSTNQVTGKEGDSNGAVPSIPGNHLSQPARPRSSNRTLSTFQRAANIMRESLDLGSHGGVIIVGASDVNDEDNYDSSDEDRERKVAKVWAMSGLTPNADDNSENVDSFVAAQMDSSFVRRMIKRHPRGGLWYFQHERLSSSSDEDGASSGSSKELAGPPLPFMSMLPQSLRSLREKDLQAMRKHFPDATRIIFAPLWDSFNSRWFGGCFCWSNVESRVFSAHVDLGGLFGFGSSLMVEHSRIQSQESAQQKSDFISTISHEMRSPLHGILASNEFLAEHIQSEFAKRLLDTIRACGQTLLDTFEQILDFTKINAFERALKRPRSPQRASPRFSSNENRRRQTLHILKLADVVAVVEDAVESVYSGQILSNSMTGASIWQLGQMNDSWEEDGAPSIAHVDVTIDAAPQNWNYVLEAGALRRIVMNVFGNALKYTEKGSVALHLETQITKKGNPVLVLTISDTGKGISNDYLQSKIFTPFSQEDPLSPGAGLGLSLVRDILRSVNGNITIKSQIGVGTVVKMVFPLTHPEQHDVSSVPALTSRSPALDPIQSINSELHGKVVSFVHDENSDSTMPSSFHTIKSYLTEWFGMSISDPASSVDPDLLVVDERDLYLLTESQHQYMVLILCRRRPKLWSSMTSANGHLRNAVWLTLPCGPHQLARTLQTPFKNRRQHTNNISHNFPQTQSQTHGKNGYFDAEANQPAAISSRGCEESTLEIRMLSAQPHSTRSQMMTSSVKSPPARDVTLKDAHHTAKNASLVPSKQSPAGLRILLVEDNAINLALLRKSISRVQPQILHTAVNGEKAVDLVEKLTESYQYIFMDLSMPVMDGFEASRRIRLIEARRQCATPAKIIALTGLGSDEHILKAYAAGINVFLRKPVSLNDIMGLLNEQDKIPQTPP